MIRIPLNRLGQVCAGTGETGLSNKLYGPIGIIGPGSRAIWVGEAGHTPPQNLLQAALTSLNLFQLIGRRQCSQHRMGDRVGTDLHEASLGETSDLGRS